MKYLAVLIASLWLAATALGQSTRPARPVPAIERVLIISVDGLRPDLALRADTPVFHALLAEGSFSMWARTTAESVTLPSHTSMLTGVPPIKHGVQWNSDLPLIHPVYPAFPTIFELAKRAGYSTAMVAGKAKFINLAKPGTLDWQFIPAASTIEDAQVCDQAVEMIREHQPELLFVHLPSVDNVGHAKGWSSPEQMAAIAGADKCIGKILAVLDEQKLRGSTFILVTSDHGGSGRTHGPDDPRSRHIPWIVVGPGIRKGLDLTIYGDLTINTEDTFSTVAYLLGIGVRRPVDGHEVMQILDRSGQELIHPQG